MAATNEEIARRIAAGVAQRDTEMFIELSHPQVEWHSAFSVISEGGAYHGHDGIRQYVRDLEEAFADFEVLVDQTLGVGDVVIAVGRMRYTGRVSAVPLEAHFGWVFRFKDSLVVYIRAFRDPEQALGALGEPEST